MSGGVLPALAPLTPRWGRTAARIRPTDSPAGENRRPRSPHWLPGGGEPLPALAPLTPRLGRTAARARPTDSPAGENRRAAGRTFF